MAARPSPVRGCCPILRPVQRAPRAQFPWPAHLRRRLPGELRAERVLAGWQARCLLGPHLSLFLVIQGGIGKDCSWLSVVFLFF